MKKVLIPIASGFEEIEAITVTDILRRAGAKVIIAATCEGIINGSRGIKIQPDALLDSVMEIEFDLICLPGGQPGTDNLKNDSRILNLLVKMFQQEKWIAAICAAPIVLKKADIIKNYFLTSHPSVKSEFNSKNYLFERVVVDGKLITSQSPGTAMEFALKLVEILFDSNRLKKVNDGVLA